MALVNQDLVLDVVPGPIPPILHLTEYDENMEVVVTLRRRGQPFQIPTGTTVKIEGTLKGHPFSEDGTPSGNTVTFMVSKNMTAYSGRAWTKVVLTKDNKPVSTCGFWLDCDRPGVEAGAVIQDSGFEEQIKQGVTDYIESNDMMTLNGDNGDAVIFLHYNESEESWDQTTPAPIAQKEMDSGEQMFPVSTISAASAVSSVKFHRTGVNMFPTTERVYSAAGRLDYYSTSGGLYLPAGTYTLFLNWTPTGYVSFYVVDIGTTTEIAHASTTGAFTFTLSEPHFCRFRVYRDHDVPETGHMGLCVGSSAPAEWVDYNGADYTVTLPSAVTSGVVNLKDKTLTVSGSSSAISDVPNIYALGGMNTVWSDYDTEIFIFTQSGESADFDVLSVRAIAPIVRQTIQEDGIPQSISELSQSVSETDETVEDINQSVDDLNSVNFITGNNIFDAEFVNAQISGGVFSALTNGISKIAEEAFLPVVGGEQYTLSFIAGSSYINLYIYAYDSEKNWVSGAFSNVFVGVQNVRFSTVLNVPSNIAFVRFYAFRDNEPVENMMPTEVQLERGSVATEYKPASYKEAIIPKIQEDINGIRGNLSVKSKNMLDVEFVNATVSSGTFTPQSTGITNASHAELIEVEPSAEYVMSWIPTELMIHCYVYEYNSNNDYLTYTRFSTNRATPARAENSFTVGSTTKYIRIRFYREDVAWQDLIPEELQLEVGHTATDYEEPGEIFAIPVLEKKVAELDGGYLPNYYDAYLPGKIDQIKTLLKSSVVNGDAFYFITDMHWDKNAQNSPAIIKRMNKELRIDKLFTGGDITPNGYADQPVNKLMDAMGGKDMVYGINGNHEFLDDATYADIFYMQSTVLPNDVVFGNTEKNYYYFNNHKQKIRYIVLAAFGEAVNGAAVSLYTDAEQLAWLTNTALNVDSGWTIIILTHSYYSTSYNGGAWGGAIQESPPQTDHGFTNAIKDYVQNGDGEIACIITGHLHYDRIFENEGMPKVVAVTCDKYAPWIESGTDREPWLSERVLGTVTEQAFDVVILDKVNRTVKFVRVGGDAYDGINGSFGNAVQIRTISY